MSEHVFAFYAYWLRVYTSEGLLDHANWCARKVRNYR